MPPDVIHGDVPHREILDRHDKVLIVDFGSQVTQLIARRVREAGVYCEIVPFHKAEAAFAAVRPKAVILSGGPASVLDDGSPRAPQAIFEAGIPVLGICYGQQTDVPCMLGGKVEGDRITASSAAPLSTIASESLSAVRPMSGPRAGGSYQVWMSHGDRRHRNCRPGFTVRLASSSGACALVPPSRTRRANIYGDAVPPMEVVHTPAGRGADRATSPTAICGLPPRSWDDGRRSRTEAIEKAIRAQIGKGPRHLRPVGRRRFSAVTAVFIT